VVAESMGKIHNGSLKQAPAYLTIEPAAGVSLKLLQLVVPQIPG
jgi:hypothetical protein